MTETKDSTSTGAADWEGTNLAGDVVAAGIAKNAPEYQEDLRWFYRYAAEKNISQAKAAEMLNIDGGTYSKVYRGEYKNSNQLVLPPPVKMLSRIRNLREQEEANAETRIKGRVMTETVTEIHFVCRKAWRDQNIAFIFGDSHIGKTEALVWFRDENNHGATLYVDLQGVCGEQDLFRAFARALKISPDTPIAKLRPRIYAAIDRTNLIIVDEFHHITYAYQKGGAIRMINALKSIKDRTGCAMVICSTNVGREEFDPKIGKEAKLLNQLWRRGVIKLQLPEALRVADVRAFAQAFKLDFPPVPVKAADTWKSLAETHPQFEGLQVCDRIAHDFGVKHLVCVFQDGITLAKKRKSELQWKDVNDAQRVYDNLSAKKIV